MSTIDKKIVISLPRFSWDFFLNLRFVIALSLLLSTLGFSYWYHFVRPFFSISTAHVEVQTYPISCDVEGRIVEMGPLEGESVKKGQMLFTLDSDLVLARQALAKRNIVHLTQQIQTEKEKIGKAMEQYLAASEEFEIGIGSQEKVKRQLSLMEEAQQKSENASEDLKRAQSELSLIDLQVKKMTVTAPFDGIVLKKAKDLGTVAAFGEPVYILCNPDKVWIEAEIPEKKIGQIKVGTSVLIQLPAYPKQEWKGKVSWIAPATIAKSSLKPFSGQNEMVPIKVVLDSPEVSLKPGLSAQISLQVY